MPHQLQTRQPFCFVQHFENRIWNMFFSFVSIFDVENLFRFASDMHVVFVARIFSCYKNEQRIIFSFTKVLVKNRVKYYKICRMMSLDKVTWLLRNLCFFLKSSFLSRGTVNIHVYCLSEGQVFLGIHFLRYLKSALGRSTCPGQHFTFFRPTGLVALPSFGDIM